jgi:hypothetical protein
VTRTDQIVAPFMVGAPPSASGASGTLVWDVLDDETELLVTVTLEEIGEEAVRDATPVEALDVILWLA